MVVSSGHSVRTPPPPLFFRKPHQTYVDFSFLLNVSHRIQLTRRQKLIQFGPTHQQLPVCREEYLFTEGRDNKEQQRQQRHHRHQREDNSKSSSRNSVTGASPSPPTVAYTRTGPCPSWCPGAGMGAVCTLELKGRRFQSKVRVFAGSKKVWSWCFVFLVN